MENHNKVAGVTRAIGVDDTGHAHAMHGTLKLFTHFKVIASSSDLRPSDSDTFKRVTLATYCGVKSTANFNEAIAKFKFLNPTMKNVYISYEYVIRQFV